MSDFVSSAPGIYIAMLGLLQDAGAAQSPPVQVFPFELGQYEPGSYITVHAIENHVWEMETISYSGKEHYDISGIATVFTGEGVADSPTVGTDILTATYDLFNTVVMTTLITNRNEPTFGTTGPSPYQPIPGFTRYTAGPGRTKDGQPWGWMGVIDWSWHFDAYIVPA